MAGVGKVRQRPVGRLTAEILGHIARSADVYLPSVLRAVQRDHLSTCAPIDREWQGWACLTVFARRLSGGVG
jgi:hypothetical protein